MARMAVDLPVPRPPMKQLRLSLKWIVSLWRKPPVIVMPRMRGMDLGTGRAGSNTGRGIDKGNSQGIEAEFCEHLMRVPRFSWVMVLKRLHGVRVGVLNVGEVVAGFQAPETDWRAVSNFFRSTPADPASSFSEYQTRASTASHSKP